MEFIPVTFKGEVIGVHGAGYPSDMSFVVSALPHIKYALYLPVEDYPDLKVGDLLDITHNNSPYPGDLSDKLTIRLRFPRDGYNPKEGF